MTGIKSAAPEARAVAAGVRRAAAWLRAAAASPRGAAAECAAALLRAIAIGLAAALACGGAAAQGDAQPRLPAVDLAAGMYNVRAEVAHTPEQRATGLMHRREMAAHEGMLFVFDAPATQCFWMKNTLLPLSIAFIADDGTIVNIADMRPQSLESHCSSRPVRYALEMNQGWFAKRGIQPGFRLSGAPFRRAGGS